MQKYDSIWTPDGEVSAMKNALESKDSNRRMLIGEFTYRENVIVLTVEEAKELWNAAQDRANALQLGDPGDTQIFETYLQSKGINIEG